MVNDNKKLSTPSESISPQQCARKGYLVEQLVKFFELMCTSFLGDAGDL